MIGRRQYHLTGLVCLLMLALPLSSPTFAGGHSVYLGPAGTPYQVLRSSDQLQSHSPAHHGARRQRATAVSPERVPTAPAQPRVRQPYAYGWFGAPPRTHQQIKPSVDGLSQSYRWQ